MRCVKKRRIGQDGMEAEGDEDGEGVKTAGDWRRKNKFRVQRVWHYVHVNRNI